MLRETLPATKCKCMVQKEGKRFHWSTTCLHFYWWIFISNFQTCIRKVVKDRPGSVASKGTSMSSKMPGRLMTSSVDWTTLGSLTGEGGWISLLLLAGPLTIFEACKRVLAVDGEEQFRDSQDCTLWTCILPYLGEILIPSLGSLLVGILK